MKRVRVAAVAAIGGMVAACTAHAPPPEGSCRTFDTSLSVRDAASHASSVFSAGDAITFHLAITNTAAASATLTASSPCTAVVFEVFDSAEQRLWGSADDVGCIQTLQPRAYAPEESVDASSTWSVLAANGAAIQPGTYQVRANVAQYAGDAAQLTDCRELLSKSATFTIQ